MRKLFVLALFAFALNANAQKPFTLPEVQQWESTQGTTVPTGRIICKDKSLTGVAERLATDYTLLTSTESAVVKGTPQPGDIIMTRNKKLAAEEYRITIGCTINIEAATATGAHWAAQTLLQMSDNGTKTTKMPSLPCGVIQDKPAYQLRGFMIDVGRKFIPMDYLRKLVRVMSYYKMNTLQVHLNDNGFKQYFGNDWNKTQAAFRMESDYFPGLTAKDGHYTKAEFHDFIIESAALGVEIIPEFDVPAHALAFTHYRPSLGSQQYGMDHLDLSNPAVEPFVDSLFTEYLAGPDPVFCCPKMHVGTDEYSNATSELRERFRAFTDHCIRLVEGFKKRAMLWGSLSHAYGDTPVKVDGVLMEIWSNGFADPLKMKEAGYQMVSIPDGMVYIVPAAGYYYDYLNCEWLYNEWGPHRIGGVTLDEGDPQIEGGMFAVWNDHAGNGITVKDIHHRTMPALQVIAEKTWGHPTISYNDWNALRAPLHEAPGINELGRIGYAGSDIEVGYPYEVEFTVECAPEEKGAVLSKTDNATFYLSDPQTGRLGYEREGYLHTFNYALPKQGKVTIKITGDNNGVTLFVDGKQRQRLDKETLWVTNEWTRYNIATTQSTAIRPEVHKPTQKMAYVHTLVFPLATAGRNCLSSVSKFNVKQNN